MAIFYHEASVCRPIFVRLLVLGTVIIPMLIHNCAPSDADNLNDVPQNGVVPSIYVDVNGAFLQMAPCCSTTCMLAENHH